MKGPPVNPRRVASRNPLHHIGELNEIFGAFDGIMRENGCERIKTIGDAVNIASRMEAASEPMQISVSETTHALISGRIPCESRGSIPVKGREAMNMYWVERKG